MSADFNRLRIENAISPAASWRIMDLAFSLALAALLVGSWIWGPSRGVWDEIDYTVFRAANGVLSFSWWQRAWAYANHRNFDNIGVVLFAGLLLYVVVHFGSNVRRNLISVGLLAVLIIGMKTATSGIIAVADSRLDRQSPTLVHEDALRLSQLVPDVKAKDASQWSFPGDHAFVVLSILIYLGYCGDVISVRICTWMALLWTLPRLIGGSHWFSDIAVGSTAMALTSTGLLMATPLHDWLVNRIDKWTDRVKRRLTASRLTRRVGLRSSI